MDANRGLPVLTLQDLSPESHRPPPRIGTDLCLWDEEALQDGCSDQGAFHKGPRCSQQTVESWEKEPEERRQ